ncbi:hypothetical protein SAMN06265338_11036 [Rhodoblastus acidophilus]|uniref:Uncharacterized protein n=1 Tax=Rhodoblastus acidophilus TaxID=1074 RepID=A0A212S0H5_RHOAC|nr:hypothetical protein [Rhodoblastus acidophilus]PPQ38242.1 hypothetical protein CKO16_11100 [Rhodoblastus acidophilus]RAI21769.1 hypothetical protein CH337_06980 [Rhodoblastus acidophilus]SNB78618.1 hypothetical protein SAMN06265338_11036 [Rhodoblastus acidophilus]
MSIDAFALLEVLFPFALVIAFLAWQLRVTKRSIRDDQTRAARELAEAEARAQAERDKAEPRPAATGEA